MKHGTDTKETPPEMTPFLLQPATNWTGQTHVERLKLCLEAAYVHGLINARSFNQGLTKLTDRAEADRERLARAA